MRRDRSHFGQLFAWAQLPPHLQEVSKPFGELAEHLMDTLPENPETTTALRKLLEAKDCAVRSKVISLKDPASS